MDSFIIVDAVKTFVVGVVSYKILRIHQTECPFVKLFSIKGKGKTGKVILGLISYAPYHTMKMYRGVGL
jgi:hypothetical protein